MDEAESAPQMSTFVRICDQAVRLLLISLIIISRFLCRLRSLLYASHKLSEKKDVKCPYSVADLSVIMRPSR